jgi:hypothetical protein
MADSTLLRTGETPPGTLKGHGTSALGPSDSSDSGSDIRGGPGLVHDEGIGLAAGTTSDPDVAQEPDAGADIGDADLDSDSDRFGTGERAAAGRDATPPVDRTLYDEDGREIDGDDIADEGSRDLVTENDDPDLDDANLDTTLGIGERGDPGIDAGGEDDAGRGDSADGRDDAADVEREAIHDRADGKPVDDDVPVFDRAWRDDRPGM